MARNAYRWSEIEVAEAADKRVIENGIHDNVHRVEVPTDDRPNFRREMVWLPVQCVVAELKVRTIKESVVVRMGPDKEQADFSSVNRRATFLGNAVERKVKPGLEPIGNAISPLGYAVERFVWYQTTGEGRRLRTISNKIIVPREVEDPGFSNHGVIHLDFIGLAARQSRNDKHGAHYYEKRSCSPSP